MLNELIKSYYYYYKTDIVIYKNNLGEPKTRNIYNFKEKNQMQNEIYYWKCNKDGFNIQLPVPNLHKWSDNARNDSSPPQ